MIQYLQLDILLPMQESGFFLEEKKREWKLFAKVSISASFYPNQTMYSFRTEAVAVFTSCFICGAVLGT